MTMYTVLAVYAALVLLLAWRDRSSASFDAYLMGGRDAAWYGVGASIFSLIGGGEIVALTALGFIYGAPAISLFAGYALGFFALGLLSPRIRRLSGTGTFVSLPDFIHSRLGSFAGGLAFAVSFAAFFALLMIQFSAGGALVAGLTLVSYSQAVLAIGVLVTTYLFIGGFRTVIATDMLQGVARFLLVPLLVGALFQTLPEPSLGKFFPSAATESMSMGVITGLILTGFFSAVASADVWQRIYAARSDRDSAFGLSFGAILMLLFGLLLVYIGVSAKVIAPASVADAAFSTALSGGIPPWVVTAAIALVLVSVLSTADTEIFVLTSLIGREASREGNFKLTSIDDRSPPTWARTIVVLTGALSTGAALLFSDVIQVYVWLICLLLAISPAVLAGIFGRFQSTAVGMSILLNLALFGALAALGRITADTAYLIVLPGFALIACGELVSRLGRRGRAT